MLNSHELLLITDDAPLIARVEAALAEKPFTTRVATSLSIGLSDIYASPPAVILVDQAGLSASELKQLQQFKQDNLFAHTPFLLLVAKAWEKQENDWRRYPVEDYITVPFQPVELRHRIMLAINRLWRLLDPNPLTRMPGNTSVLRVIQESLDLKKEVVIGYVDLDNFKAFNDRYGFSRGDEALRLTGRLLAGIIGSFEDDDQFLGHIGGDDFIFILHHTHAEKACQKIITSFDVLAPRFYDDDDRSNGYTCIADRSHRLRYIPLLSISIAAIDNRRATLRHHGEVSSIATEITRHIKNLPGSNYLFDRRHATPRAARKKS